MSEKHDWLVIAETDWPDLQLHFNHAGNIVVSDNESTMILHPNTAIDLAAALKEMAAQAKKPKN